LLEGRPQPQQGVVEDVVGLLPAPEARKALEHAARQPPQALAGVPEQALARGPVSGAEPVDPGLQLGGVGGRFGHGTPTRRDKRGGRGGGARSPGPLHYNGPAGECKRIFRIPIPSPVRVAETPATFWLTAQAFLPKMAPAHLSPSFRP